jgi:16S rRNA (cytosine967-C5)-methyltransferase
VKRASGAAGLAAALRVASEVVAQVAAGRSLTAELERRAQEAQAVPRPALIDLTHGTLRRYGRVQAIVRELSRRSPDPLVESLLWCALYALDSGRYAAYTVVDQAVRACALLEKWPAKGYVNGLLRSYLRERAQIEARIAAQPEARYQHPPWWIELVQAAYPGAWQAVLEASNTHPPMCLRINRRRTSLEQYAAQLAATGMRARSLGEAALLLEEPVPVERLPGFEAGLVSVQDAGAQRAAGCLALADGQRVLDACAAPGGKTAHILEAAQVELTALDLDAARTARISRNLERLGLSATVRVADAARPADWWDGRTFDRVLADVPCTASGVVRRHPDIKWLRRAGDVEQFAARQGEILDALWRVLAPGGKLLYVTCSVFPRENGEALRAFLTRAAGAAHEALPDALPEQGLPCAEHDGFYYALITKQA